MYLALLMRFIKWPFFAFVPPDFRKSAQTFSSLRRDRCFLDLFDPLINPGHSFSSNNGCARIQHRMQVGSSLFPIGPNKVQCEQRSSVEVDGMNLIGRFDSVIILSPCSILTRLYQMKLYTKLFLFILLIFITTQFGGFSPTFAWKNLCFLSNQIFSYHVNPSINLDTRCKDHFNQSPLFRAKESACSATRVLAFHLDPAGRTVDNESNKWISPRARMNKRNMSPRVYPQK